MSTQWLGNVQGKYLSVCSVLESACFSPDLPSCLFIALASRPTAPGSFLQAEPLVSVSSTLCQANFHLFGASFFLYASFILLTFLLLPVALLGFHPMAVTNRLKKKSYTSTFSVSCVSFETSVVIICLLGLRGSGAVIVNIFPSSFSKHLSFLSSCYGLGIGLYGCVF